MKGETETEKLIIRVDTFYINDLDFINFWMLFILILRLMLSHVYYKNYIKPSERISSEEKLITESTNNTPIHTFSWLSVKLYSRIFKVVVTKSFCPYNEEFKENYVDRSNWLINFWKFGMKLKVLNYFASKRLNPLSLALIVYIMILILYYDTDEVTHGRKLDKNKDR